MGPNRLGKNPFFFFTADGHEHLLLIADKFWEFDDLKFFTFGNLVTFVEFKLKYYVRLLIAGLFPWHSVLKSHFLGSILQCQQKPKKNINPIIIRELAMSRTIIEATDSFICVTTL